MPSPCAGDRKIAANRMPARIDQPPIDIDARGVAVPEVRPRYQKPVVVGIVRQGWPALKRLVFGDREVPLRGRITRGQH